MPRNCYNLKTHLASVLYTQMTQTADDNHGNKIADLWVKFFCYYQENPISLFWGTAKSSRLMYSNRQR